MQNWKKIVKKNLMASRTLEQGYNRFALISLNFETPWSGHPSFRHTLVIRHKGDPFQAQKAFDTSFRPSVTSTKIRHFFGFLTDCRNDVSKWRMVEVKCRSDGFWGLKRSGPCVEVTGGRFRGFCKFKEMTKNLLNNPSVKDLLYRKPWNLN